MEFAELEQTEKNPPAFGAKIDLDYDMIYEYKLLNVWDNEKIAFANLEETLQSVRETGTVNLEYLDFARDDDTVELESEYLDFSQHLDEVYDDFMYHSTIFNNEHIEFVNKHGELPYDLNSPENRAVVLEYINIQLESGSNLSENQKETLTDLKNQISEIKEMEAKLGIDEGDLKFVAETKNIKAYSNEVREKYDERNAEIDEQDKDAPF